MVREEIKCGGSGDGGRERRKLMETIVLRKKRWIGHVLRGESMLREVMEGKMVGKRGRGRRRIEMLQELYDGGAYGAMKRRAEDRIKWKSWMRQTCRNSEH